MACVRAASKEPTALESHARSVKMRDSLKANHFQYPMYTVPFDILMEMTEVRPHQELLTQGRVVQFKESLGKAVLVSHQWISDHHPDPEAQQLKVLQLALQNLRSGTTQVSAHPLTEFVFGTLPPDHFQEALTSSGSIFFWYDYFSVPQFEVNCPGFATNPNEEQAKAIASIPGYVEMSEFFVALCPALDHRDSSQSLNQYTWAQRGWCRTERMVREVTAPKKALILLIESPKHLAVLPAWESNFYSPGDGEFSIEQDRHVVGTMMRNLIETQMRSSLILGDLASYRFYLNHQHVRLRNCQVEPLKGLLPPREETVEDEILEEFFYQNGFRHILERDAVGWSPLHYAALGNSAELVQSLLEKRANVHCRSTKAAHKLFKGAQAIGIAAAFGNDQVVRVLLAARADATGAFTAASLADHPGIIRILYEAGGDPSGRRGMNAIDTACALGATRALRVLLELPPSKGAKPIRHLLHIALSFNGGNPDLISMLINFGMNVNEAFYPEAPLKYVYFYFGMKYRLLGPSRFRTICYHHRGATPLMLSVLSGYFTAAELLLQAKAEVGTRNARCMTAFDLAVQSAPQSLLNDLLSRGADRSCRISSLHRWQMRQHSMSFSSATGSQQSSEMLGAGASEELGETDDELILESF